MIEIYLNGQAVELAPGTSVSMVFNNTLFDSEVLQGSYSFPFNIPATPKNRMLFGFPEIVERLASLDTEFDCLFRYDILAVKAKLKVRDITRGNYSVNLFTQVGAIADKLKNNTLNQLPLATVLNSDTSDVLDWVDDVNTMFAQAIASPANNFPCAFFPILNTESFDDTVYEPTYATPPYVNFYIDNKFDYSIIGGTKQFFTPFPYLSHVLYSLFQYLGIDYSSDADLDWPEFKHLVLYSNTAAVRLVRAAGIGSFLWLPFYINLKDHMPDLVLGEFLNAIRSFFFLGFVFDTEARQCTMVRLKDILARPYARDWSLLAEASYKIERIDPQGFLLTYQLDSGDKLLGELLPDISKYKMAAPVQALTDLPTYISELGNIRLVVAADAFYLCSWSSSNHVVWKWLADNYYSFKVGAGTTTRDGKLFTLLPFSGTIDPITYLDGAPQPRRFWKVPQAKQALSVRPLGIDSPATLRLMFYWGMQNDSFNNPYPFGSPDNVAYDGTQMGNLSLRYDGQYGIYEQLGKEWLTFLQNTKKVTRSIRLTPLELKTLSQADKIRIDGNDYLWRSCKVSFPITKAAEVELWKV